MTNRRSWVEHVMGMPISVHLRGPGVRDDHTADLVVTEAFRELRMVDQLFSTYRPTSQVTRIRHGELPRECWHPWVHEVVELCEEAHHHTDGYFDAWPPTGFDPSGLVKGWAAERAADALAERTSYDSCLNAGGDILVHVHSTDSPPWRVAIEDPRDNTRVLTVRNIRTGGIATSGTAARGTHIRDPHTGTYPDDLLAITITGPTLLWADIYATAAFARGGDITSWLHNKAPEYQAIAVL